MEPRGRMQSVAEQGDQVQSGVCSGDNDASVIRDFQAVCVWCVCSFSEHSSKPGAAHTQAEELCINRCMSFALPCRVSSERRETKRIGGRHA